MHKVKKFRHVPGMSERTMLLIDALKRGRVGDTYSDMELADICGEDTSPKGEAYANLMSAIRNVRRHNGVAWARIRDAGQIRCLSSEEIVAGAQEGARRVHRHAGRELGKLKCADMEKLKNDDRTRAATLLAQLGTLYEFSSRSSAKVFEAKNENAPALDLKKLVKALS